MNDNKKTQRSLLGVALLGCLLGSEAALAGAFGVPTYGTPGWGRAFAGGALWQNDPAAAYNNPAAMAFIDRPVGQVSAIYADIDLHFKGDAYDYQGNPRRDATSVDDFGIIDGYLDYNDGGNGGFNKWLATSFLVWPLTDRLTLGLSQVVPMGMESTWDRGFVGQDFAVTTRIETIALNASLSFKLDEQWALGGGVTVQRTRGFVSQNVDLLAAAGIAPNGLYGAPAGQTRPLIRAKVDNVSPGWFASLAWQPNDRNRLGLAYHARIRNEMEGRYNFHISDAQGNPLPSENIMDEPFFDGQTLVELFYPGLRLYSQGARAESRVDVPARATLDWVHQYNERLTLGASLTWTQWSSFESLRLESRGMLIADIPYNYKDTWMYSFGGDYRLTDQVTLRGGVAFDQTPTRNSTRDAKIPDGDRTFLSLGLGYQPKALPELSVDVAYSRQFVDRARLRTQNQDRLGGGSVDGRVDGRGQIFALSATYAF